MSEEKSVEDYLDEAAKARAPEAPAEDAGKSAKPETGTDTADQADDEAEEQEATAADDADESQEGDDSEDFDGDSDEPKPKRPSKAQKRIRKLVRERDEANERLREREAELRVLIAQAQNGQARPEAEPKQHDAPPKQDDYQDYAKYLADVAAWAARMETKKVIGEAQETNQQRAKKARDTEAHNARVSKKETLFAKGEDAFEDFTEVASNKHLPVSETMTDALLESEDGHKVLYYLGQNPDEAGRIANLNDVAQVRELTKLELQLSKPASTAKKPTRASEPMKPVKGGGSPRQFDPDTCSMKEYMDDFNRKQREGLI